MAWTHLKRPLSGYGWASPSLDLQGIFAQLASRGTRPIMERIVRSVSGRQWKMVGPG